MRVRLAMCYDPKDRGTAPRVLSAMDQYTEDDWGGATPDYWENDIASGVWSDDCLVREITVEVPDSAIVKLFAVDTTVHPVKVVD